MITEGWRPSCLPSEEPRRARKEDRRHAGAGPGNPPAPAPRGFFPGAQERLCLGLVCETRPRRSWVAVCRVEWIGHIINICGTFERLMLGKCSVWIRISGVLFAICATFINIKSHLIKIA